MAVTAAIAFLAVIGGTAIEVQPQGPGWVPKQVRPLARMARALSHAKNSAQSTAIPRKELREPGCCLGELPRDKGRGWHLGPATPTGDCAAGQVHITAFPKCEIEVVRQYIEDQHEDNTGAFDSKWPFDTIRYTAQAFMKVFHEHVEQDKGALDWQGMINKYPLAEMIDGVKEEMDDRFQGFRESMHEAREDCWGGNLLQESSKLPAQVKICEGKLEEILEDMEDRLPATAMDMLKQIRDEVKTAHEWAVSRYSSFSGYSTQEAFSWPFDEDREFHPRRVNKQDSRYPPAPFVLNSKCPAATILKMLAEGYDVVRDDNASPHLFLDCAKGAGTMMEPVQVSCVAAECHAPKAWCFVASDCGTGGFFGMGAVPCQDDGGAVKRCSMIGQGALKPPR